MPKSTTVFDGHNDTLTHLYRASPDSPRPFVSGSESGHIDLPRARAGGLGGGFFAISTPPPEGSSERDPMHGLTFTEDGYVVSERSPLDPAYAEQYTDMLIAYAHELDHAHDEISIVTSYPQLKHCLDEGVFTIVLHIEGAEAVREDLSNLESLYERGIRSIGPVWSRPNVFGQGVPFRFPDTPDIGSGLTDAGKTLVKACNELGIMIDLAHMNLAGFRDVAALSSTPLVVTHADVHAICPSTRNLIDEQIDAVADSGGLIGINFETLNTHPKSSIDRDGPVSQITAHIDYIAQKVGVDHVAFGSDFDGAVMPDVLSDASKLPALVNALLEQGYSETDVKKITYRNWLRVLEATWK